MFTAQNIKYSPDADLSGGMMTGELVFQRVLSSTDVAIPQIVSIYIEAFGGPPYFEKYNPAEVRNGIILPHLEQGVIAASIGDLVCGFVCWHKLRGNQISPDAQQYIETIDRPFDSDKAIYISELAVSSWAQRSGIGGALVARAYQAAKLAKLESYILRTDFQHSNSIRIFQRLGAMPVGEVQRLSQDQHNGTRSLERIYLWGKLQKGIELHAMNTEVELEEVIK